jgi:cysteinyl-tRNA synthetase
MARNTIKKIDTFIYRLYAIEDDVQNFPDVDQLIYDLHHGFEKALDDDINISGALAAFFDFIGKINAPLTEGKISRSDTRKIVKALEKINEIVGIMDFGQQTLHLDITELIQKREAARKAGLWQEADVLRNQLAGAGVEVLDSQQGTIWRFK